MIKIATRIAEVGKIKAGRKGNKRQGKNGDYQLPEKTDHWIITTLERDPTGNFMKDKSIHKSIGEKPKDIEIMFLTNDIDEIFPTSFSYYEGKKQVCKGDGEKGFNQKTNKAIKCPCKLYEDGKCKIYGILNCILPVSNKIGGVYRFRTHGYNSVSNILASLQLISVMTQGQLALIVFKLTLQPKKVEKGVIYMANIIYEGDIKKLFNNVIETRRDQLNFEDKMKNQTKLIDWSDDGSTDQDIIDEFFPNEALKQIKEDEQKEKVIEVKKNEESEIEKLLNLAGIIGVAREIYIKNYDKDREKTINILKNKIKGAKK